MSASKQFRQPVEFLSTQGVIGATGGAIYIAGALNANHLNINNTVTIANLRITNNLTTSTGSILVSSQWTSYSPHIVFTSGNIGIGTTTPGFNLDISGGSRITGGLTTGTLTTVTGASIPNILASTITSTTITANSLYSTYQTTTNILSTNISSGTLSSITSTIPNSVFTNVSTGTLSATTSTIPNSVFTNISTGSMNSTNLIITNISTANLNAYGTINTLGNIFTTGGNVGIKSTAPSSLLHVSGSFQCGNSIGAAFKFTDDTDPYAYYGSVLVNGSIGDARLNIQDRLSNFLSFYNGVTKIGGFGLSTSSLPGTLTVTTNISSSALYTTNQTTTNSVFTNVSTGTLSATTSTIPNSVFTNVSTGTLSATTLTIPNSVFTNVSTGTLSATTSTIPNSVFTNVSTGTIISTNLTVSANTRLGTTIITDNSAYIRMVTDSGITYIQSATTETTDSKADLKFTSYVGATTNMTLTGAHGNLSIRGGLSIPGATTATPKIGQWISIENGTFLDDNTAASGTVAYWAGTKLDQTVLQASNASVTYTNAATLFIDSAPFASTNITATNLYSILTLNGDVKFGASTSTTSNTTGALQLAGGIGISNNTDASSSTNGGSITTAGGAAIGKKLFVGTDLTIAGSIGIGTPAITYRFDLDYPGIGARFKGSGTDSTVIRYENTSVGGRTYHIGSTGTGSGAGTGYSIFDVTSATSVFLIDVSGNVNITKKLYIGGGEINLFNGTSNIIVHGTGVGAPTQTTRSIGTKIVLNSAVTASTLDYAIGIEAQNMWFSVPNGGIGDGFKWYTGNGVTNIMRLGSSQLNLAVATESNSPVTGSIITAGGMGIAKKLYVGGGEINLGNNTSNWLHYNTAGVAAPSFTTRSVGTKLVLYNSVSGSGLDFAIGIEADCMWSSVFKSGDLFKWYFGSTSPGMTLSDNQLSMASTADSTSTNTGSIVTNGGMGIAKKLYIGGGEINLTNGTSNIIVHGAGGGAPAQTTRSVGTKIVLNSGVTATSLDYAIGIESQNMWFSVPNGSGGDGFKWYTGNGVTNIMRLGSSQLNLAVTTESNSPVTGSIITAGGMGIAKKLYVGTNTNTRSLTVSGILDLADRSICGNANFGLIYSANVGVIASHLFCSADASTEYIKINSFTAMLEVLGISQFTGAITSTSIIAATSNNEGSLKLSGGIGISNATDATSSINGGTITTAGGAAIAKKLYVGTDLYINNVEIPRFHNGTFSAASSAIIPIYFGETQYNYAEIKIKWSSSIDATDVNFVGNSDEAGGGGTDQNPSEQRSNYLTNTSTAHVFQAQNSYKIAVNAANNIDSMLTLKIIRGNRCHFEYTTVYTYATVGATRLEGQGYLQSNTRSIKITPASGTITGMYSTVHSY